MATIKIYKAINDTTYKGKFIRKGSEFSSTTAIPNVNFKLIKEDTETTTASKVKK